MDDSQKTQQNMTKADDQTQQIVTTVASTMHQPAEKKAEAMSHSPIGMPSKEGGPAFPLFSESLISSSTPEMIISPELHKETGAEAVSEVPILSPEDTKAGIVHAKESTPVSTTPVTTIVLPMTQQQAQQTVNIHKKVKDSLFWFAMLVMRQWQIAQKNKKKEAA